MGSAISAIVKSMGSDVVEHVLKPFWGALWQIVTGNAVEAIAYENNDYRLRAEYAAYAQARPHDLPHYYKSFPANSDGNSVPPNTETSSSNLGFEMKRELKEKTLCRACDSHNRVCFIFQCGHLACIGCANYLEDCWSCNTKIVNKQFLSFNIN